MLFKAILILLIDQRLYFIDWQFLFIDWQFLFIDWQFLFIDFSLKFTISLDGFLNFGSINHANSLNSQFYSLNKID